MPKITDPQKIVTDKILLAHLEKTGVDKDYVQLKQDYASDIVNGQKVKGKSPYAKFYEDTKSGKKFVVISSLPRVDVNGVKIEAGWNQTGDTFTSKNNLFQSTVKGNDIELKVGKDILTYKPQLFLEKTEQTPSKPVLLTADPENSNYTNNVLEWDYGICKRRLRIIEGKLLGSWIFATNPNGKVNIKYNQTGDFKLKLGRYKSSEDEELIPAEAFISPKFGYPIIINDSFTSSTSDGAVYDESALWADVHGSATGDGVLYTATNAMYCEVYKGASYGIFRVFFYFDTSTIPDGATITAASLTLYGYSKAESDGDPSSDMYVVKGTQADPLVVADYDAIGSTPASDSPYSYNTYSVSLVEPKANTLDFNDDGIGFINKTGVTKLALSLNGDFNNSAPTGDNYMCVYSADKGTGYFPTLIVTYSSTNFKLNVGDTWKAVTKVQLNIGDSWKAVTKAQLNIGDTWK